MRRQKTEFKFEVGGLVEKARRLFEKRISGVTINLPFISFDVSPKDRERTVARGLIIRMVDRRILNASECCDDCIENALKSLQEIRSLLVDKQVDLADLSDGSLYLLIEFMAEGLRQFLTHEERLRILPDHERRQEYFATLEALRAHLHRCLVQVGKVAAIAIPKIQPDMRYDESWTIDQYVGPTRLEDR